MLSSGPVSLFLPTALSYLSRKRSACMLLWFLQRNNELKPKTVTKHQIKCFFYKSCVVSLYRNRTLKKTLWYCPFLSWIFWNLSSNNFILYFNNIHPCYHFVFPSLPAETFSPISLSPIFMSLTFVCDTPWT